MWDSSRRGCKPCTWRSPGIPVEGKAIRPLWSRLFIATQLPCYSDFRFRTPRYIVVSVSSRGIAFHRHGRHRDMRWMSAVVRKLERLAWMLTRWLKGGNSLNQYIYADFDMLIFDRIQDNDSYLRSKCDRIQLGCTYRDKAILSKSIATQLI